MRPTLLHHFATLLLLLMQGSVCIAGGAKYNFAQVDVLAGLPANYVSGMAQDSRGLMWFGTIEGLCRYDGKQTKAYPHFLSDESLAYTKEIRCIVRGEGDILWIGTADGLYEFNTLREEFRPIDISAMTRSEIIALELDNAQNLWIGTKQGLYTYNITRDEIHEIEVGRHSPQVNSANIKVIKMDSAGNIWIGYWNGGVARYNHTSDTFTTINIGDPRNRVLSVFEDQDHSIYLGTWYGEIFRVARGESVAEVVTRNISEQLLGSRRSLSPIYTFELETKSGNIWIGTNHGVYRVEDLRSLKLIDHISTISQCGEIGHNNVALIYYEPKEEILWLGTRGGGVNILQLAKQHITKNSLNEIRREYGYNTIRKILDDGERVWIVERDAGLFVAEKVEGQELKFRIVNTVDIKNIITIIKPQDSDNQLLIGTRHNGVLSLTWSDTKSILSPKIEQLEGGNRNITTLFEDDKARIWIGCNDGLMVAQRDTRGEWRVENLTRKINCQNRVVDIAQHHLNITREESESWSDDIWVATRHDGVRRITYNDGKIEARRYNIKTADGLKYNNIMALFCDSQSRLWVGTSGLGVVEYNIEEDNFIYRESPIGRDIGTANSIIESRPSVLWVGTNNGAYTLDTTNPKQPKLYHITSRDGLSENACLANAIETNEKGEVYIGHNRGYSVIDPAIYEYSSVHNLTILDIKVNNTSVLYPQIEYQNVIERDSTGVITSLRLNNNHNNLSFTILTPAYTTQSNEYFRYKLEGYDREWHEMIENNTPIQYTELGWGKYRFVAYDENDSESDGIVLDIKILRPIYASWGAIILYILIIIYVANDIISKRLAKRRLSHRLQINIMEQDPNNNTERATVALDSIELPNNEYTSFDERLLAKAIEVVNDNIANSEFSLTEFVEQVGVTNSMLYRKLKSMSGMTPNEFIRHIRLQVAHKILTEKYRTITTSEVAYAVGFNIPKYFSKRFTKQFGYSPTQYREQLSIEHDPATPNK